MSVLSDLTDIKTKAGGLKDNKVTRLAYDQNAYDNNSVASPEHYDWEQHNNIPPQTIADMKMTNQQIEKGFRLRFPILNKYFFNAFFGRVSYNLNKLTDFFYSLTDALINALGAPNGLATLDANGRLPASQATETLMSLKGAWSASTNTPHLSDGMSGAVKGDMYISSDTGTVTFGTGNTVSFLPDDRVVYDGAKWCRWSAGNVRRVCELLPDGNGNIDLTQQSDIYKVLNKKIIGELFYWGIGRKWVKCSGGESYNFRGLSSGNNTWFACARNYGLWWSEDGKAWSQGAGSASYSFYSTHFANGLCVAGSYEHGLWWSTNGRSWTQGTGGTTYIFNAINYANGIWVAGSGSHGMWWSTDGKAWTQATGNSTSYSFYKAFFANNIWVAPSTHGLWWSEDGKAWTQATGGDTYNFYSVIYANGIWIAGSTSNNIWWSTDGKNWTQGTGNIGSYTARGLYYANGLFCCASSHGMWYSEDGKAWTQATGAETYNFSCVKYANSIWLASTEADGLWISNDGKVWWQVDTMNVAGVYPFANIAFDQGMFIVASTAGLWYSDWTTIDEE